jgi:hypothetical protein
VWEETAAMEVARVTAVLAAETSAQEATAAWDSATFCIKGAEDRAALVERQAQERVSRVEAENAVSERLPSSRVSFWRHARLERWPRRIPGACPMRWLGVSEREHWE